MLSIPDMALLGTAALLLFGPDQLPRIARKAGHVMRDIQNTSQSFIREMERAADLHETPTAAEPAPPPPRSEAWTPPSADPYGEVVVVEPPRGVDPYDSAPQHPPVGEKLAEPRPALDLEAGSAAAEAAPHADHPTHV